MSSGHHNSHRHKEYYEWERHHVAKSGKQGRGGERWWQDRVNDSSRAEFKVRTNMPIGINDRADPGIGDTDDRQPFLDGAQTSGGKVLVWPGRYPEPTIVGDIQDQAGLSLASTTAAGNMTS